MDRAFRARYRFNNESESDPLLSTHIPVIAALDIIHDDPAQLHEQ